MKPTPPIRDRLLARLREAGERGVGRSWVFYGMPYASAARELAALVVEGLVEARHEPARHGRVARRAATVYVAKGGGS